MLYTSYCYFYILSIQFSNVKDQTDSDEQFIEAVRQIMQEPVAYANEVAAIVGCNPRIAGDRLKQLVDQGILISEQRPRGIAFKLP